MKMFNTMKLGVVTLAAVGMIAACGGGSSSKSSAAGVAAKPKPVCSVDVQIALRDFLTEETRAKLASGADLMDLGNNFLDLTWVLVSKPVDDSWHHEVYLDEDAGVVHFSTDDITGDYKTLTLIMFGTGSPESYSSAYETEGYSYRNDEYSQYYSGSYSGSYSDFGFDYDIANDLNFAYIDLDDLKSMLEVENNIYSPIPLILLKSNLHSELERLGSGRFARLVFDKIDRVKGANVLFPNVINGGVDTDSLDVTEGTLGLVDEPDFQTSYEMTKTLLIDLAKAIRVSGSSLEDVGGEFREGVEYWYSYDSDTEYKGNYDYETNFLEYLKWYETISSFSIERFDKLQSGTLDLHNTGLSKACFAKVIKEVPLDGDIDHGIKPVNVIDLSDNKTVDVEMVKAMLKSLREEDKGNNIIFVDVRDTSITAEQAEALIEEEGQLGDLEVLGDIRLIHEGNRAEYDSYD